MDTDDYLKKLLGTVAATDDPLDRASQAHALVSDLAQVSSEASRLRREAIEGLIKSKVPQTRIADRLNISRARVSQLANSGPSPERALLSHDGGPVTVALGSKEDPRNSPESDMISRDATEAYDTIRDTLGGWGVTCTKEIVPAPGIVDLNRDRLIVLGSPKVLPTVGQIMASDQRLSFGEDKTGRYLIDHHTGTVCRSPQDDGEPADCAYIGRLPRPDGQGSFLYLAGIHAAGTNGAARYLVDNAPELYKTAKDKLFSLLVRCTYESRERSITHVEAVTDTYLR